MTQNVGLKTICECEKFADQRTTKQLRKDTLRDEPGNGVDEFCLNLVESISAVVPVFVRSCAAGHQQSGYKPKENSGLV
jgi:hypothetical protein